MQSPGGRPRISEVKQIMLQACFRRGMSCAEAAKATGVHRNTALFYRSRSLQIEGSPPQVIAMVNFGGEMPKYLWAKIEKEAAARHTDAQKLVGKLLEVVAADNLFVAVLTE